MSHYNFWLCEKHVYCCFHWPFLLNKRIDNFIFTFHNTNENFFFLSHYSPPNHSLFDRKRGWVLLIILVETSTVVLLHQEIVVLQVMHNWWKEAPLSPNLSGWVIPGPGSTVTRGPDTTGMCPPIGGLIPGAGPTGIIPGGGRPITGIMGGPPMGCWPHTRARRTRRLGRGWVVAPAGQGAEDEVVGKFPCWRLLLFCQSDSEPLPPPVYFLFKKYFIFDFREKRREGEREGEKHGCEKETMIGCLQYSPREPGQICNPGMCPGMESNGWHFNLQDNAQSTEPHWLGLCLPFLRVVFCILFVFPTIAVCFSHRWKVMGDTCITLQ